MAIRALACIAFVASLAGCATTSTKFLVAREEASTVVYRPGTSIDSKKAIRLHLPWVDVSHCADRGVNFRVDNLTWFVRSSAFSDTYAELPEATVRAFVDGEEGFKKVLASTPSDTECAVQLRHDAPASLRGSQNGMMLLQLLVAERLPMRTTEAWQDQYDYDARTRSMNILPGMRLRLDHETAIVTDATRALVDSHAGALAAPVHLQLLSGGDHGAKGSWTPTLSRLKFAARNLAVTSNRPWFSASGINDLAGEQPRYWRLYVPGRLLPPCINPYTVDGTLDRATAAKQEGNCSDPSSEAKGVLNITESLDAGTNEYGAFMLVGASERAPIVKLIDEVHQDRKLPEACKRLLASSSGSCFVFRYRVSLVPEIPITIQGEQQWLEVGVTLRDLVQARAARRLRDYGASPTLSANAANAAAYADVGKALQEEQLLDVLREATLTRRFSGAPVAIEPRSPSDLPALLDINIQMGDEIKWRR